MVKAKKNADTKNPWGGITILQQTFCEKVFENKEISQGKALQLAGSTQTGMSAEVYASQLLKKPKVQAYLNHLRGQASERAIVDKVAVLKEIKKLAFSNIKDYVLVDDEGDISFIPFDQIDVDKLAAIESIKVRQNTTHNKDGSRDYTQKNVEFKLYSKDSALEKLMKHLGLYEKDNDQKGKTIYDILAIIGISGNGDSHKRTKTTSSKVV